MKPSLKPCDGITLPSKKVCPRCNTEKKAKEFNKRTLPSGNIQLSGYCKLCEKEYKQEWREK